MVEFVVVGAAVAEGKGGLVGTESLTDLCTLCSCICFVLLGIGWRTVEVGAFESIIVLLSITDREVLLISLCGATCGALLLLCFTVFVGCDICCLCCVLVKEEEEDGGRFRGVESSVFLLVIAPTCCEFPTCSFSVPSTADVDVLSPVPFQNLISNFSGMEIFFCCSLSSHSISSLEGLRANWEVGRVANDDASSEYSESEVKPPNPRTPTGWP